jgi:hypothetical protein
MVLFKIILALCALLTLVCGSPCDFNGADPERALHPLKTCLSTNIFSANHEYWQSECPAKRNIQSDGSCRLDNPVKDGGKCYAFCQVKTWFYFATEIPIPGTYSAVRMLTFTETRLRS